MILSRKNISLFYDFNFSNLQNQTFFNLKNLQFATNLLSSFFIKKGNKHFSRVVAEKIFLNLFFSSQLKQKKSNSFRFLSAGVIFNALERGRAYTRLLHRFIRGRVRRVPAGIKVVYQRKKVFKSLFLAVAGKKKRITKNFINELFLILKNSSTSKVFFARDSIHKQCDTAKVYIKKPRFKFQKKPKISIYSKQYKKRLRLRFSTISMLRIKRNPESKFRWRRFKKLFIFLINQKNKIKPSQFLYNFRQILANRLFFRLKNKITKKRKPLLPSPIYRIKMRVKRLRKKLFFHKFWRDFLTCVIYQRVGIYENA